MQRFIVLALVGFVAQLIDGALGMAYGVTSTSLLLVFGIAPAAASASVHLAEVVTTAASGVSHWRLGNVDRTVVKTLILPGSIGAFAGACFLSSLPGETVKPYVSVFLFLLGFYVLARFLFLKPAAKAIAAAKPRRRLLLPLGLFAGFADATGGGGWGPLTTPILLSRKGAEPRKVVGSVDTSEFAIAVSATLGFLISLGWTQVSWTWVAALMAGGVAAAPLAAWLVKVIPSHLLGVLVGGLIILTNAKTLLESLDVIPESAHGTVYGFLAFLWVLAIAWSVRQNAQSCSGSRNVPSTRSL